MPGGVSGRFASGGVLAVRRASESRKGRQVWCIPSCSGWMMNDARWAGPRDGGPPLPSGVQLGDAEPVSTRVPGSTPMDCRDAVQRCSKGSSKISSWVAGATSQEFSSISRSSWPGAQPE